MPIVPIATLKNYFLNKYVPAYAQFVDLIDTLAALGFTGWNEIQSTLTYASATTITISGDFTGFLSKGDKLRYVQSSTTKYALIKSVVYSSPNTTITIYASNNYVLANAAITFPYFSKVATPVGWPNWFTCTPTWTSDGTAPSWGNATVECYYNSEGGNTFWLKFAATYGSTTTFGTGNYTFTFPIGENSSASANLHNNGTGWAWDSSANLNYPLFAVILGQQDTWRYLLPLNAVMASGIRISATYPFTWANGDKFVWQWAGIPL